MKLLCLLLIPALTCLLFLDLACSTASSGVEPAAPNEAGVARFEIEVKMITASADACSKLGLGDVGHVVSADAANELVEAAASTCGIVSRPRIVVTEGSVASIVTSSRTEYVKDFDADATPVMGSIEQGVHIQATPKSAAGESSEVAFSVEVSGLHEPMRSAQLALPGSGKSVTVQLPELETQRVRTSFVLGGDQAAILPLAPTPGGDPVRAIVLRVRRIV